MSFRVGIGYDVHKLQAGYNLCLGGIVIDHSKGTVGHSDGDVLIHAIIDALFGAAGLADIGTWFPDTEAEFKGIDSKILLQKATQIIDDEGYSIVNIDSTICLQNPKIKSYIGTIKQVLAEQMGVEPGQISVKATTTEKLGFVGREEGVSSRVVVLLKKK
ncbi:MAG: 2-C-methyl-D-erythritol 2,4-cyclodiphosphate synthase [Bacteroidales bacterium]|nr:2-C-methyl-D-erythritol 2,4-cyclodiphosphate synthase [Bacteroidales bacterium]